MHALDAGISFHPVACPRLVPLIEGDDPYGEETEAAVREYAAPLQAAGVDTVILGCTHYPLIRKIFERVFGRDVTLVFSAEETAREVAETLARKGVENERGRDGRLPLPHHRRPGGLPRARPPLPAAPRARRRARDRGDARGGCGVSSREGGRRPDQLRSISFEPDYLENPHGSVVITQGRTKVLCTAMVEEDVPRWLRDQGRGWITAEYSLLPASTGERVQREAARGKQQGRTVEIQRLIGRAVRAVADFEALGERTLWLDCDVLQADGGTRCAAICGAYVARDARARAFRSLAHASATRSRPSPSASSTASRSLTSTTPRTRTPTPT